MKQKSDSALIRIRRYHRSDEAGLASMELEQHGIRSEVVGGDLAVNFAYMGDATNRIDLLVLEPDVERAVAVLEDAERAVTLVRDDQWLGDSQLGWVCEDCGEVNQSNFDYCWSCEVTRPANPQKAPFPDDPSDQETHQVDFPETAVATATEIDPSPYATPGTLSGIARVVPNTRLSDDASGLRQRAWRAIVFSALFPPLAVYAMVLVLQCLGAGLLTARLCIACILMLITMAIYATIIL